MEKPENIFKNIKKIGIDMQNVICREIYIKSQVSVKFMKILTYFFITCHKII